MSAVTSGRSGERLGRPSTIAGMGRLLECGSRILSDEQEPAIAGRMKDFDTIKIRLGT